MQTFLPYDKFLQSASVLDTSRLGKQRSEAKQILMVLLGETQHWKDPNAWRHHPAVLMWRGYEISLAKYGIVICETWINQGHIDNTLPWFKERYHSKGNDPHWLGDPSFHAAHRSNLLRKDPEWYGQFGWRESPDLPYVWPENTVPTAA